MEATLECELDTPRDKQASFDPQLIKKANFQLCIVHMIHNSLKLVASKDQKKLISDLKTVYQAPNEQVAYSNLLTLVDKWNKYVAALKAWINHWDNLSTYFRFSSHVRKPIYTTNPIEGFHGQIENI